MNYSNVIGFLLFVIFLLQFFSGILLSCYYSSFAGFSAVYYIMIDVNVGWLVRFVHVLGASIFMFFILLHWIRGTWIRFKLIEQVDYCFAFVGRSSVDNYSFVSLRFITSFNLYVILFSSVPFRFTFYFNISFVWFSGLLILFCVLGCSFLGYCLCWGQMSYWGITVMINILTIIPLFGSYIGSYLWCSSLVVLNKIFMFHFFLGFIVGFLVFLHIALLHMFSSFNLVSNNLSSILLPFYALFFKDCFVSYSVVFILFITLFCEPDIFGSCDNLLVADPLNTPNHIVPEWYFLWLYCILRSLPFKTIGVIIVIFLFILFALLSFYVFSELNS